MYATAEELKKIMSGDLTTFNEVLSRVKNKATEDAIRATPELAIRLIKNTSVLIGMVDEFNKKHPEFQGHEDIVRGTIQRVESENPGSSYAKILELAAPEITKTIALTKGV